MEQLACECIRTCCIILQMIFQNICILEQIQNISPLWSCNFLNHVVVYLSRNMMWLTLTPVEAGKHRHEYRRRRMQLRIHVTVKKKRKLRIRPTWGNMTPWWTEFYMIWTVFFTFLNELRAQWPHSRLFHIAAWSSIHALLCWEKNLLKKTE